MNCRIDIHSTLLLQSYNVASRVCSHILQHQVWELPYCSYRLIDCPRGEGTQSPAHMAAWGLSAFAWASVSKLLPMARPS